MFSRCFNSLEIIIMHWSILRRLKRDKNSSESGNELNLGANNVYDSLQGSFDLFYMIMKKYHQFSVAQCSSGRVSDR